MSQRNFEQSGCWVFFLMMGLTAVVLAIVKWFLPGLPFP